MLPRSLVLLVGLLFAVTGESTHPYRPPYVSPSKRGLKEAPCLGRLRGGCGPSPEQTLWERVVMVTGGCGFSGSVFVDHVTRTYPRSVDASVRAFFELFLKNPIFL
jgi:hypothetical protein